MACTSGTGELQFNKPRGIAINGDVLYVADEGNHRIQKLTTGGEFLGTYGEKGTGEGQFTKPSAVGVSPEGKVYVGDSCNRVQVFNSDWSLSHVIAAEQLKKPEGIAFDLSGNVHVACRESDSVLVFSPAGDFVHEYGQEHLSGPDDVCIDSSNYSFVANYHSGTLSIFNAAGEFVRSVEARFKHTWGVAVSDYDGSIWLTNSFALFRCL